jgi:hypothetical protein
MTSGLERDEPARQRSAGIKVCAQLLSFLIPVWVTSEAADAAASAAIKQHLARKLFRYTHLLTGRAEIKSLFGLS